MEQSNRVLLDTSVYSYFARGNEPELWKLMLVSERCHFYGFEVVRRELAATPKRIRFGKKPFRLFLLEYYDRLVRGFSLGNNFLIESIAQQYQHKYRGRRSVKALWNDFLIVACASFHDLDVLISEDRATMLSKAAREAYKRVNEGVPKLRTPQFFTVRKLAELV